MSVVFAAGLGAQDFGAQGRASNQPADNARQSAPKTPRSAAPKDLTGYWVSEVTELWRYRMMVPDKNDYEYVPLNPEGRKVADTWDPAKDQASGNACKSYGAPAIMQVPGRLHIYWQDDNTLRDGYRFRHADPSLSFRRHGTAQAKRPPGKDSRWPPGRETKTSTRVTAKVDRYKTKPAG